MEILPFATRSMNPESIIVSEMSKRERQMLYDFTYMWNLKNKTEHNKTVIATDIENKQMAARGEGMGWGRNRWGGLRGINF